MDFFGESAAVPVIDPAAEATPVNRCQRSRFPTGGINVRSGPGQDFDSIGQLDAEVVVNVTGKSEDGAWWQVEFADAENGLGWITAALVDFTEDADSVPVVVVSSEDDVFPTPTLTPTVPVPVGRIAADGALNVRAEPSLEGTIVGGLYLDEEAEVFSISEDGEWWEIEFADGPEGRAWISAEFVRFFGDPERVPVFGAATATPTPAPTDTPAPTAEATPSPTLGASLPTLAPTATSVYDATAEALVEGRATPNPDDAATAGGGLFSFDEFPWGIVAIVLLVLVVGLYLLVRRR